MHELQQMASKLSTDHLKSWQAHIDELAAQAQSSPEVAGPATQAFLRDLAARGRGRGHTSTTQEAESMDAINTELEAFNFQASWEWIHSRSGSRQQEKQETETETETHIDTVTVVPPPAAAHSNSDASFMTMLCGNETQNATACAAMRGAAEKYGSSASASSSSNSSSSVHGAGPRSSQSSASEVRATRSPAPLAPTTQTETMGRRPSRRAVQVRRHSMQNLSQEFLRVLRQAQANGPAWFREIASEEQQIYFLRAGTERYLGQRGALSENENAGGQGNSRGGRRRARAPSDAELLQFCREVWAPFGEELQDSAQGSEEWTF